MGREREIAKTGFFLNYVRHALRSFTLTLSFPIQFLGEVRLYPWTRQWHPTPVLLPGKSHGQRSLVGCSPWGHWETRLSAFTFTFHFYALEKDMATHSSVLAWGESRRWGRLVGCHPWGRTESDTTEAT